MLWHRGKHDDTRSMQSLAMWLVNTKVDVLLPRPAELDHLGSGLSIRGILHTSRDTARTMAFCRTKTRSSRQPRRSNSLQPSVYLGAMGRSRNEPQQVSGCTFLGAQDQSPFNGGCRLHNHHHHNSFATKFPLLPPVSYDIHRRLCC